MTLELVFPIHGQRLPVDHSYPLYGALSGVVPAFHDAESRLRFAPITGAADEQGQLILNERSHLRVRLPDDRIKLALPLAGKRLVIAEGSVRVGIPAVRTLVPAPNLLARIVTFKNALTPNAFLDTARVKLKELQIDGEAQLPIHLDGDRAGEPKRRVIRIHDKTIVGYALMVSELSAEHSLRLQEEGLGGRTQMGCGFFTPMREVK